MIADFGSELQGNSSNWEGCRLDLFSQLEGQLREVVTFERTRHRRMWSKSIRKIFLSDSS